MNNRIILCDDTHGAAQSVSKYVTGERRTFVGVEIRFDEKEALSKDIDRWRSDINPAVNGVTNFHFTDILNCRKGTVWENKRDWALATFEAFAVLFQRYQIETFVQTIEPYTLSTLDRSKLPSSFMGIKIKENTHIAFLFMLSQILRSKKQDDCIHLMIEESDEFKKAGHKIIDSKQNPSLILDFQSKQNNLLQFADFVAFMVNRINHIESKGGITSDIDKKMLEIGSLIAETINCKSMTVTSIDPNADLKAQFETFRILDRDAKGLPLL